METKGWAIFAIVMCTLLTSSAQVFYKKGTNILEFNLHSIITNYYLLIGLVIYAIASIVMILAFKGGDVNVIYPIVSLSYIWVSLLSMYFFNEKMGLFKWIGIAFIILGVVTISYTAKRVSKKKNGK